LNPQAGGIQIPGATTSAPGSLFARSKSTGRRLERYLLLE
jgi:hypothetical protein